MNTPHYNAQPRPRAPLGLLVAGAVVLLVPIIGILLWLGWQWHTLEATAPFVSAWLRYVLFLAPLTFGMWYAGVGAVILWRRWGDHRYIQAHHVTQLTKAQRIYPEALHSLSYHDSHKTEAPAQLALPELPAPMIAVPTFAQLLDSGAVAADRDYILGYGDEGAVTGDLRSLYSAGIGGLQGSGKTWTAAYLLAQSAIHGAKLIICDPHADDKESLASRVGALAPAFVCGVADDDTSIHAALKLAGSVLQKRKDGDTDRTPLIVAVDEWSTLRRGQLADLLPAIVESFSTEGRKFNCNILLLGQRWDKASVGDFRNTLTSSYVHRMRSEEGRMMTGLPAGILPANTLSLKPGEAYFISTRGDMARVQIPPMTQADMVRVGTLLGAQAPQIAPTERLPFGFQPTRPATPTQPLSNHNATTPATPYVSLGSAQTTPEHARVLALFKDGKTVAEIVRALYGDISGAPYTRARNEIETIIRAAIQRGA